MAQDYHHMPDELRNVIDEAAKTYDSAIQFVRRLQLEENPMSIIVIAGIARSNPSLDPNAPQWLMDSQIFAGGQPQFRAPIVAAAIQNAQSLINSAGIETIKPNDQANETGI